MISGSHQTAAFLLHDAGGDRPAEHLGGTAVVVHEDLYLAVLTRWPPADVAGVFAWAAT